MGKSGIRRCLPLLALLTAAPVALVGGAGADTTSVSTVTKTGRDLQSGSTATGGGTAGTTAAGDEISWVVDYRSSTGSTANVTLTDPIAGNHTFVAGSLQVPPGWNGGWSTDGGSSFAASEPAGGVNAISASGRSIPGSTGAETETTPGPAAFQSASSGGDGWEALFVGNRIYNVHHHANAASTSHIDCHERTGVRCSGAYPRYVSPTAGDTFGTGPATLITAHDTDAVVNGTKIYYPVGVAGSTSIGVVCADVSTQKSCGYTKLADSISNNSDITAWINGGAVIGSRLYMVTETGRIVCFDSATGAACPGFPLLVGVADPGVTSITWPHFIVRAFDDRYLFTNLNPSPTSSRNLSCVDLTTNMRCPGFPKAAYTSVMGGSYNSTLAPILNADGDLTGICGVDGTATSHPFECYSLQGTAVATPFSTTQAPDTTVNWLNNGKIAVIGARMYFAETASDQTATYTCWDFATASPCQGFVKASSGIPIRTYTLVQDPVNPDCIWEEGDADRFEVFSATFGGTDCSAAQARLELEPAANYCDGQGGHVTGWDRLTIHGVTAADYTQLAVTITDANGDPVPGWTGRIFPNTQSSIDISGIPVSSPTNRLSFSVSIAGLASSKKATVRAAYAGDPVQVCFRTRVGAARCTAQTLSNTATVVTNAGAAGGDAPGGNSSGPAEFVQAADQSLCRADLRMTKTGAPDPVVPGEEVRYTLRVTNDGPDVARNAVVSDPLPGGLTYKSGSPGCSASGGTVTCALGDVAAGETRELSIEADSLGTLPDPLENTARVTSDIADPDPDDNAARSSLSTRPRVNLAIAKRVSDTRVAAGGGVIYTLVVTNDGPSDATGVRVEDPIPDGIRIVAADPSQGSCSTRDPLVCDLGRVDADGSAQILLAAETDGDASGDIRNTAVVGAAEHETDPDDNDDSATLEVVQSPRTPPQADLRVSKRADDDSITLGDSIRYTIVVRNDGPAAATDVVVTDTSSLDLRVTSLEPSQGRCGDDVPATCRLGTIAAGDSATIRVRATPRTAGFQENCAGAVASVEDPDPRDNLDCARTTVRPLVDLRVTKIPSADAVPPGGQIAYVLVVRNAGPDDATGVRIEDPLPAALTVTSASPTQGDCDASGRTVACNLGSIVDGASAQVVVTASVASDASGDLVNTACAAAAQRDLDERDDCSTTRTRVDASVSQTRADLEITKSVDDAAITAGDSLVYTVLVRNLGPDAARGVRVTDTAELPLRVDSVTPSQGTCTGRLPLDCVLGELAAGAQATIVIRATPERTGTFDNWASVIASDGDAESANGVESARTEVRPHRGLRVSKRAERQAVARGGSATYTIEATNTGVQPLSDVEVCDVPPRGMGDATTSPAARRTRSGWCWTIDRLRPRSSRTFRITLRARPGVTGNQLNRVTANADNARVANDVEAVFVGGVSACGRASASARAREAGTPRARSAC